MSTKQHNSPYTEVELLQGPPPDYINPALEDLYTNYHVFTRHGSIILERFKNEPTKKLMDEFPVEGLRYSASGELLGVVLKQSVGGSGKTICITMDELRTPKKLAAKLEEVGLTPPLFSDELNAVAAYIGALAKQKNVIVIHTEGLRFLGRGAKRQPIGVFGTTVYGLNTRDVFPIIHGDKAYVMHGELSVWQTQFGLLLQGNHLLINATIFGLAPPLAKLMNYQGFGFFVRYDRDIAILNQLISNLSGRPRRPKLWSNRSGAMESCIIDARDRVITLEEQGQHSGALIREAMHLHESRHVTCEIGHDDTRALAANAFIFATGGLPAPKTITQMASRTDYESRLITLTVDEAYGVISQLNGFDSVNAFVAKLSEVMGSHYGLASQFWTERLLNNLENLQTVVPKKLRSYEVELAGSCGDIADLTAVERQVLHHFAFTAVVGWVAIKVKLLPLASDAPLTTAKHLFCGWLKEWRGREVARESAPLKSLQEFLFTQSGSFLPLTYSDALHGRTSPGYIKDHETHGRLFLLEPEYFENLLCKDCGVDAMVRALRTVSALVSDSRGRLLSVRMPGRGPGNENRVSFYAIKESMRFYSQARAVFHARSDSLSAADPASSQEVPHA